MIKYMPLIIVSLCCTSWAAADAVGDYQAGVKAYQEEDLFNAMTLLQRASAQGHTGAKVMLAYILDKANEHEQAAALYQEAAAAGDPQGELGLAQLYAIGQGVERDLNQASSLLMSAAEKGHAPAMMMLAEAYRLGEMGFAVDSERSHEWLLRAAQAGSEQAQERLEASTK